MTREQVFAAVPGLLLTEELFEAVHDRIFCVKNQRRQYISVNTAFAARARAAGKRAVLGRTAREIFPPLLAAGYEQQDDLVFSTGHEIRDKLEMVTNPDGTTGWYLTQKLPVRDGSGNVIALAAVSADLESPVDGDPRLAALAGAIEQIHRDYRRPLRIADLASKAKMSLSQFERRLHAVLRVSPRQLLTRTRVDAAAMALREMSAPIRQIAIDCGFYDQALLCRQFRQATGLTPGQYRATAAVRSDQ
jgi:AraC-like DNA-binding protein